MKPAPTDRRWGAAPYRLCVGRLRGSTAAPDVSNGRSACRHSWVCTRRQNVPCSSLASRAVSCSILVVSQWQRTGPMADVTRLHFCRSVCPVWYRASVAQQKQARANLPAEGRKGRDGKRRAHHGCQTRARAERTETPRSASATAHTAHRWILDSDRTFKRGVNAARCIT